MKVEIKKLLQQGNINICLLSKDIFNSLNLSEDVKYKVHLGQSSEDCSISLYDDEESTIKIPEKLFGEFLIYNGISLNIRKENEDIYLGPVVGIFISPFNLPLYEKGTAPRYHGRAAISQNCLCYYFSIKDIDWNEGKIKGYTLRPKSEEWEAGWFPLPDVVYDRGVGFFKKHKPIVKEIREKFQNNHKIKIINSKDYLGKKETYEKLTLLPEAYRYLPKTIAYGSFNDLIIMLKKYNFLFLKASFGSGGKKVLSVEKEDEKYKLTFYSKGLKSIIVSDIEELRDYVEKYTEGKEFIIQEGIKLLKYKGSVFDMRLLIIKNSQGKWRVISNEGRIARGDYTITNYSAGGGLEFYKNMYTDLIHSHPNVKVPEEKEIEEVTIKLAEYIEKAFGRFGELGMDIAIDMQGKIWLIEANVKPDKDIPEWYDDFDGIPLQNIAIFEYARFLAGFNN